MKRAVIVGYGNMGSKYAARIHGGEAEGLSLYGIVCRNAAGQQEIRARMPEVAVFSDEDSMLAAAGQFDALIITTPHKEHVRVVRKAQQAGLHILCEKPLGITAKECEGLAQNAGGKVNAMVFNWRARDVWRQVYACLDGGKLGRIRQVLWTANFWYRPEFYHKASAWRSSWRGEGGGLLINQSQHLLDMWNWLFGQPCTVSAHIGYGAYSDIEVDDKVSLFFAHENGMWGSFYSSTGDSPGSNRLEIHGELGKLVVEDNQWITLYQNEDSTAHVSATSQEMYPKIPFTQERREVRQARDEYTAVLQNFADAMEGRAEPLATFLDGQRALETANAAYLSDWQQRTLAIPCDSEAYCRELEKRCEP
ncbi:MAG: Gfo/Idh/MocA family oxidoreductase [Roseburia sp.]|nr:Gfo/Idh/MocA family oxidoreductase [Roseburia sp.]